MIRAEHAGEAAPDMLTEQISLEFATGMYRVHFGGKVIDAGTFEVGGAVDCHTIVLHGREGPNAGRTIPCIFQLRGDRLRVCYGFDGLAPTDYSTDATNQRYLAVYRRL